MAPMTTDPTVTTGAKVTMRSASSPRRERTSDDRDGNRDDRRFDGGH